jgi:hypothetical protein
MNEFAKVSHPVALILTDVLARDVALVAAVHQPLLSVPVNKRSKDNDYSQHTVLLGHKKSVHNTIDKAKVSIASSNLETSYLLQ